MLPASHPVCVCLGLLAPRRLDSDAVLVHCQPLAPRGSVALRQRCRRGWRRWWRRASLGDPAFTSLFYECALFVHTQKCLSFLLLAVVFTRRRVFSLGAISRLFVFLFHPYYLRALILYICVGPREGCPHPTHWLSLDRGGRLGCLVMAT